MSEKQLLIEACEFGLTCNLSDNEKNKLTESLRVSQRPNDCLLVKGVPSTVLNTTNQNGRIYPTALMQKAINEAKPQMENKMLVCSGDEHPAETSYPRPSSISHIVTNAYIKNVLIETNGKKERKDVLFCDFLVLPTIPHGMNLQKFITEGIGCGISIRGLGSCDPSGKVTEYSFLGADVVGQPSSSVYLSTPIGESVSVSVAPNNKLEETFVVSASSTNVVRDLDSALVLQQQIDNANFGTVKKTSTKLDSEVDPKTGAQTTMVTLETETEDEVSELDQALAMAKQAMLNGKADIDSVTIENIKEEQPKESVENQNNSLNEDGNLGLKKIFDIKGAEIMGPDDKELWRVSEELRNFDDKNKMEWQRSYKSMVDAGVDQSYLDYANGKDMSKDIENEYVAESDLDEGLAGAILGGAAGAAVGHPFIGGALGSIAQDNLTSGDVHKLVSQIGRGIGGLANGLGEVASATGSLIGTSLNRAAESIKDKKEKLKDKNELTKSREFKTKKEEAVSNTETFAPLVHKNNDMIRFFFKDNGNDIDVVFDYLDVNGNRIKSEPTKMSKQEAKEAWEALYELGDYSVRSDVKLESVIKEAKDETKDSKEGRKFVLKAPAGFVGMDGNALVFKDDPKEALHFINGKEESGLVHLSGVQKILDTMGVYDIEKYYRKPENEIAFKDNNDIEEGSKSPISKCSVGNAPQNDLNNKNLTEDNGNNTRFKATVKINGDNGESIEDIPVSAIDMDGINAEVSNLYNMKNQNANGNLSIIVTDTTSNQQFVYNPKSSQIESMDTQFESAGDIEQDGNKLSMEVDDNNKVEKEFDTPAQASVAKAGIESGKLGGDVLLSEDENENDIPVKNNISYENIEPGWYASALNIGIVGPYDTEEELRGVLGKEVCDIADRNDGFVNISYVEPDELETESKEIDEVLYNQPGEASDPYIMKPLQDAKIEDGYVEINNIDWDQNDLFSDVISQKSDSIDLSAMRNRVEELPDSVTIKLSIDDLPDDINEFKQYILDKLKDMYGFNIIDANIESLGYLN